MWTGKIRRYVLLNLPYAFVLWVCLKLGTAYRMAEGADMGHLSADTTLRILSEKSQTTTA